MDIIKKHFPSLNPEQYQALEKLKPIYISWNKKINVISRKDIEAIYDHHVLHSLSIHKMIQFRPGTSIADIGTGGGFPGIPLAIVNPAAHFYLIDSVEKKLRVVQAVAQELDLKNVTTIKSRSEHLQQQFDFITGRAVTAFTDFVNTCKNKVRATSTNTYRNGIIYLKGGDISKDIQQFKKTHPLPIRELFDESYYKEKYILYLPVP
jgi:16S rRNA (guanine527-N7)-methyltransferase